MATIKRRVDVQIMELPLSVRTERDDAWVHGLAGQVNRLLDELRRAAPSASPQQLAVLVALNLAEELQLERERSATIRDEATAVAARALQRVLDALGALDESVVEGVLREQRIDDVTIVASAGGIVET
jgi:cell division protein ZapA (FtsZ GTPase activity inhibitor)